MSNKLSIVIPCYNCTTTLEEAVTSIYTQNLTTPFEVIMVDDASEDATAKLIIKLANNYPNVNYFFNSKNCGGGASRNAGIAKATGNLIYCLDSDNFFAPKTIQKMIDYLDEKKCDGVAFSERRFFFNKNIKKYSSQFYKILDRTVMLEDMFSKEPPLLDNFLYTKKSYEKAGGYPENHGFDTQCFELRYLSAGQTVYFCPNISFYHRQGAKEKSYFERVYESGDFSKNMYLIYEELIHLFSPVVREKIINYDVFKNSSMRSIDRMLQELFEKDKENFFISNYKKYIKPNGFEAYVIDYKNSTEITDLFCLAVYHYRNTSICEALECYKKLLSYGMQSKITNYNLIRIMTTLMHPEAKSEIEKKVSYLIEELQTSRQTIDLDPSLYKKFKRKLIEKMKIKININHE